MWAAGVLALIVAYPLSVGPLDYAANHNWLPAWSDRAGDWAYAPLRWAVRPTSPRPGLGWVVAYSRFRADLAAHHRDPKNLPPWRQHAASD